MLSRSSIKRISRNWIITFNLQNM